MHWYALYCRSQFEETVRDGLKNLGFQTFLPTEPVTRHWTDRRQVIQKPLFPGYVFARFPRDLASFAAAVRGVVCILGTPWDGPLSIPDEEIASVRALIESGLPFTSVPFEQFRVGQKVTVQYGAFVGQVGVVQRVKKGGFRLIVGISAMQLARSVELDAESLRPAKAA